MSLPADLRARAAALAEAREMAPTTPAPTDHETRVWRAMERERAQREARRRLDAEERGPVTPPALVSLRDLLAAPETETAWRVEGWQPAGSRVILAAPAKSGKTTARDGLVRCLADGDAWLGAYRVRPVAGAIAVIDVEMSARLLRAWLRQQGIRAADRVLLVPLRGRAATLDLLDRAVRAQWAALLRSHHVRYLVVDCLRPILDALGLDEHRDAGRYLVGLDALLEEAGIPDALVIHHMGHTGERSRGDSRLRDWPDVEWRIVRQDDDPASARYIAAYGRDVDVPETQLAYDAETRRLTVAGGTRRDATQRDALQAILAVLDDSAAPLSGRAVWAALQDGEHARETVYAALRTGVRIGALAVSDGPRRSRLYRPGATVSQCPVVSGECPGADESECPAPYIGRDTRTHMPRGDSGETVGTLAAEEATDAGRV